MTRRANSEPDAVDLMLEQWRRERPDLDTSGLAVFGRLHRAFNRYQAHLTELFNDYDLSISSFSVLAALRRLGHPYRCTAGKLADIDLVSTGGITQRVDKLQTAGLVNRERDPEDRRIVYVELTEKGLAVVDEVATAHFANEAGMLGGLTHSERGQLARLLSRLERSLDLADMRSLAADSESQ
ncbi:MarR family transcriptional regulator [Haloechinothrix sp. YIM 98757]|uniref:MarR family transcriptional regulator n=1 Tax=Haloechinothrix aidingensis TaxID=2752311 RepID=A0A838AAX3_9PSEU|nr:MarR family transcriptional regulator [Haloechinothrix aidingensis]MBA0126368.1 MarR family transcriptional regulator [Haloechinothrix aidingensis]